MNEAVLEVYFRHCIHFAQNFYHCGRHDVCIGEHASVNNACREARWCDDLANNSPKLLTDHAAQSTRIKPTRRLIHSLSFFIADHSSHSVIHNHLERDRERAAFLPFVTVVQA